MTDLLQRLLRPTAEVGEVVRRELLVQSVQGSGVTNRLGLGLLVIVLISLRGHEVGAGLAVWAAVMLANTTIFQIGVGWLSRHEPDSPGRIRSQQRAVAGLFMLCGFSWGGLAVLALPGGAHLGGRAVVGTAVLVAMVASIAVASAAPMLFLAFHLPLMLTAALGFQLGGATAPAALMLVTMLAVLPLQKELYRQIAGAHLLARRTRLLVEELHAERATVDRTNLRLVEANVELSHRVTRDPLTGLANRVLFLEQVTSTLIRCRSLSRPVSVIHVDLDRFRAINNTLGHAAGDELLRQIGPRLRAVALGESDLLARLGGDEFAVLTMAGQRPAEELAERIRVGFEAPFRIGGRALSISASLGVAHDDGHGGGETLVAKADAALYRAKELGRNRAQTFDVSLRRPVRERVRDEHVIGRLFGGGAVLRARFQHLVEVGSGAVIGVEVLAGLEEANTRSLSGEALRDLAERTGMRTLLDEELLRQAGRFLADLGPHRAPDFGVLTRLGRPDVEFEDISRFLQTGEPTACGPAAGGPGRAGGWCLPGEAGAALSGLILAIGEQQIVSDLRTASRRIQALRDLGARVVLDDFGRGVSSLTLLAALPLDGLRLHPDLVHAVGTDPDNRAQIGLLAGVVEIAHHRELRIHAHGVNTAAQLGLLGRLGFDVVQGEVVQVDRLLPSL